MAKNKQRAKLALAELEKELEILSKEEANACKGGAVFFDLSGNYLGRYGFGDEIRIVSQDEYRNLFWNPVTNEGQLNSMGSGMMSTGVSLGIKAKIITHYAEKYGLPTVQMWNNAPADAGFANGQFFYNPNSSTLANESSMVSTLQHEKSHLEGCMESSGTCEVDTIFKQISYPAYNNTNNDYRKGTAQYLWSQIQRIQQETGLTGYRNILSLEDAYRACGAVYEY